MKACVIRNLHAVRKGWTIIELLVIIFIIAFSRFVGQFAAGHFGVWAGIGVGMLTAGLCLPAVFLFYRAIGRRHEQRRRALREKYREIYRIVALPADERHVRKPQGAEIRVGDYGWEAEPINSDDDLIYLQGLTDKWQVVWYAGFRPDQIECVSRKPRSQYDWNYSWVRNAPPCPFPVQERETPSMGLPDVWGRNRSKRK